MTATGFDFEPQPNGDILIEFFGDDGVTINTQIITKECLLRIPIVAKATVIAIEKGKEAAIRFLKGVNGGTNELD